MNDFEFYLNEGDVKKRRADIELAKSLLKDARDRFEKMPELDMENFAKIIFENVYDKHSEKMAKITEGKIG